MTKFSALALAALFASAVSSPAISQSFTPSSGLATASGNLTFGIPHLTINCDIIGGGSIVNSTTVVLTSVSYAPGGATCSFVSSPQWTVEAIPGNFSQVNVTVYIQTSFGDCYDMVPVDLISGDLSFYNQSISPVLPSVLPCELDGTLLLNFTI